MLPGDVVGTQIYNPREGTYTVKKGPVFGNFILADEINRAPAKVQSALLEAMQEKQVTLGDQTLRLAEPFERLRRGSAPGTGLGLSIVRAIAESHGGRLTLDAPPRGGLIARLAIPPLTVTER